MEEMLTYGYRPVWLERLQKEVFVLAVLSMHRVGRFSDDQAMYDFARILSEPLLTRPALSDVAMIGFLRATRADRGSLPAYAAAAALMDKYRAFVDRLAWGAVTDGMHASLQVEDLKQTAWLAFFLAVDRYKYDPKHEYTLYPLAKQKIFGELIERVSVVHHYKLTDDERHAYPAVARAREALREQLQREPNRDQVVAAAVPELLSRLETRRRAQKAAEAVCDLFGGINRVSLDVHGEFEEEGGTVAQVADQRQGVEDLILRAAETAGSMHKLARDFAALSERLSSEEKALCMLLLRLFMDSSNLKKAAQLLRDPDKPEMVATWLMIHATLKEWLPNLPADWTQVCSMFRRVLQLPKDDRITPDDLRTWYHRAGALCPGFYIPD